MASVPAPVPPFPLPPIEQARLAYTRRHQTDYIFDFWTAFGWTVLTCGVYMVYVVYQLVRRSRDHNWRRLELLEAANAVAWDRAQHEGLADELRPRFAQVAAHLEPLRRLTTEFRDPTVWLILAILAGWITQLVVLVLLDGDLVRHDEHERAVEAELGAIYARLGTPLAPSSPEPPHSPQSYVWRVVVALVTCGIYTYFWLYDVMEDGNRHFRANWVWEDSLAAAIQAGGATPASA